MKLTESELAAGIKEQLLFCDTWSGGQLQTMRATALKYYQSAARGDEVNGSSAVVSSDVADMIEAVIAGIMPAFETERVIEFEALSADDEKKAIEESDAVNYVIMNENHGYVMLQQCLRDALLLRNGFTKVWLQVMQKVERSTYSSVPPEQALFLQDAQPEGWQREVTSYKENEDGTVALSFKDTFTDRKLRVTSIDPIRMYLSPNFDSCDIQEIPFIAEECYFSRSTLIEMGYSKEKVMTLKAWDGSENVDEEQRDYGMSQSADPFQAAQELIRCYYAYWRVDVDGDGIAELRCFLLAGSTILKNEPEDFIPYATGTGFLQPHRLEGISLFDKLKMVQDIKTGTLRQYLDCFQNGNLGRVGYVKGLVNTDHLLNPRPSGVVEVMDPNAIFPLPSIDIGGSAQSLLDYMDKVRSARGGASLDLQSAEAQVMGETAQGIERQYSVREQLAAMMARTLAETLIAGTYQNMHRALRLWRRGDLSYRTRQGFASTNPAYWSERTKILVRGGLSAGEQRQKQGALTGIMQQQQQMMAGGLNGLTVNLAGIYKACIDWARAAGIDNPEGYYVNPESPEAQQAKQMKAQEAQTQQQQQSQMIQAQLMIENKKVTVQEQKNAIDAQSNHAKIQLDYYKADLDAEIEAARIIGDTAGKLALEKARKLLDADRYREGD